ncbi:MAG TPA: hypothetical protein VJU17_11005, partial [Gemmatimonadales bacterium]|nr:hypothetical protein [Gemmatimonadales bacterium]
RPGRRARHSAPRWWCGRQRRLNVSYYYERPDQKALSDLEQVVRNLAEELAGWRRRTLKAEGELQQARANGGVLAGPELTQARQRVIELETENQALRVRIDGAKDRLRALAGRVSFLEQHGGGTAA